MEITRKAFSDFTRIFDILTYQKEKYPNSSALNFFNGERWITYSIHDVQRRVNAMACWFVHHGFKKGDAVMLVPWIGNADWVLIDFACQKAGLIVVPVHPTSLPDEIEIIFRETEAKLCITADIDLHEKFSRVASAAETSANVFHLQRGHAGYFHPVWLQNPDNERMKEVEVIQNQIQPDDLVAIMYTSGSSGVPKGVMLSHQNIIHNIKSILTLLPLEPQHRVLSFLPFSHILERAACYAYLAFGVSIYFSYRKDTFASDFKAVKPYLCTSVPRVLEKMYDFLQEQLLHRNALKQYIIRWALSVGKQYGTKRRTNFVYAIKLFVARLLVLRQWRVNLGGKIRYMIVGAASLQPEIGRLLSAAGIYTVEGYGMTETAPLISVNRFEPGMNLFGSVGLPIPGIEVKIDEPNEAHEGEVLVKGPNVMLGYFKRPELTASVFTADGWFRTGDVGKFVHHRFLKITDRKKDIFKTSSGKYISPSPLQHHLEKSPFVQRCLIIGFQRPFVAALILPHFQMLETWCLQEGIHWTAPQFMVHNIKVRAHLQHEVDRLNQSLPISQRIKGFVLCDQEWTVERGELTNTQKPVRQKLQEHYQKEVEKIYS